MRYIKNLSRGVRGCLLGFLPLGSIHNVFSRLGARFDDFTSIAKRPKVFLVGVFSVILPIVAFILVSVWSLNRNRSA